MEMLLPLVRRLAKGQTITADEIPAHEIIYCLKKVKSMGSSDLQKEANHLIAAFESENILRELGITEK